MGRRWPLTFSLGSQPLGSDFPSWYWGDSQRVNAVFEDPRRVSLLVNQTKEKHKHLPLHATFPHPCPWTKHAEEQVITTLRQVGSLQPCLFFFGFISGQEPQQERTRGRSPPMIWKAQLQVWASRWYLLHANMSTEDLHVVADAGDGTELAH